jgi:CMP-N,N'-diacetyllegionaminic acid synthase
LNIAIIPARGGSKRLHKKNIKLISGKPLIEWTIKAAIESQIFDEIHVNTDCPEISKISVLAGAKVPFIRPNKLASDHASTRDVILHHFRFVLDNFEESPETVCILQPTSPNRNFKHIISSYKVLHEKNANSVVSISELEHSTEITNSLDRSGSMKGFIDQSKSIRSQDSKKMYRINGAIYILDASLNGDINKLYNNHTFPYIMDNASSVDIDTDYDFLLAEYFMKLNS